MILIKTFQVLAISEILDTGYEWRHYREEDKPTLSCEYLGTSYNGGGSGGHFVSISHRAPMSARQGGDGVKLKMFLIALYFSPLI